MLPSEAQIKWKCFSIGMVLTDRGWYICIICIRGDVMAWWLRRRTSMPGVVGLTPAQVRPHSKTLRQGMNIRLLPDCTESGSIGVQNVQHLEIRWKFDGVLSPGCNVRLVKLCEWLLQPVQDYKPIPLPLSADIEHVSISQNRYAKHSRVPLYVHLFGRLDMKRVPFLGEFLISQNRKQNQNPLFSTKEVQK